MLTAGTKLGPYEIKSQVGAGGMGEIYKARDTRLDRVVAVKVLSPHRADRPEVRERFEREARTIASLNHPHICTLYDVGRQDGIDFLVMEYLEGESLATRLLQGPLPIEQVLQYAIEISDALDKAHHKGATHRDIKPGNIMLTKSGTKLLDFGLAKLKREDELAVPDAQLPTLSRNPTVEGTILGTLQYMSPEQLEGRVNAIDARSDIFSFGAVVYEMATGKKAFEGKSSASLIGAILKDNPPPISSLQLAAPPALDRVVRKCLEKEPEKRWQAASDVCDELKWINEGSALPAVSPVVAQPATRLRRWPLVAAIAGLSVVLLAGLASWRFRPAPAASAAVTRSVFNLPAGDQLAALDRPAVVLSPDGKFLVYVATRAGAQELFLRPMDSFEAKPISGTEGAAAPFFSPDSKWIGFAASGGLKKVLVSGGTPVSLTASAMPGELVSATWGADGTVIFPLTTGDLWRVSAAGGQPERLNAQESGDLAVRTPAFLPGGKGVLFSAVIGAGLPAIRVRDFAEKGKGKTLSVGGAFPQYVPSGQLIYAQPGVLMAAPFSAERMEVTGTAVPVVEGVMGAAVGAQGVTGVQFSISNNGSLVYVPGPTQAPQDTMVWVDRKGQEQSTGAQAGTYINPRVSPDGRRIVVAGGGTGASIYDVTRGTLTRLTFGNGAGNRIWTPDGKHVTFQAGTPPNLFWQMADGSAQAERLDTSSRRQASTSWSPDGRLLAFTETIPVGSDVSIFRLSDRKAEPLLTGPYNEGGAKFSPDGRWLAYASDESGRWEIYVCSYPGPNGKWQVSTDGGKEPAWNPKGGELFYRDGEKMMVADVITQSSFSSGKPRVLFEGRYRPTNASIAAYDVSPDGQRFLMVKQGALSTAMATQIYVVENWFEELKSRVPVGKQ